MRTEPVRLAFVDTWAWVALSLRDDSHHDAVARVVGELHEARADLVTTNLVMAEAITRVRYAGRHDVAVGLLKRLRRLQAGGLLTIVVVNDDLARDAEAIFEQYQDCVLSYVDCVSFAVMRDRGIEYALTGDHHFAVMGLSILPGHS